MQSPADLVIKLAHLSLLIGVKSSVDHTAAGQFDLLRYFEIKIRLCLPLVEIKALEIKMST